VALAREVGDSFLQADMLHRTGDVRLATGRPEEARAAWREALALLDRLGHPDAEQVRYKLRHT
jgi:predicted negative regulator of RcsB-dependent stress response